LRVARIGHFVVAVEGGYMPGNTGRDAGQECGEAAQFVGRIVEAGNEERDDLKPQAHVMDAADAVEDGSEASAEFVVVTVVETFEVDLVQIKPGTQVFENLRSAVAVGNEAGDKARSFCFFENGDCPLAGDQGLVVGADQNLRALSDGVAHQMFGRSWVRRRDGAGIAQRLRRNPVLTVGAVQIATQHTEAISECPRIRVEEWLLLDRVALGSGGISPWDVERSAAIVTDLADAGLAFGDGTAVAAGKTAHAVAVELLTQNGVGFADSLVENAAEGWHDGALPLF